MRATDCLAHLTLKIRVRLASLYGFIAAAEQVVKEYFGQVWEILGYLLILCSGFNQESPRRDDPPRGAKQLKLKMMRHERLRHVGPTPGAKQQRRLRRIRETGPLLSLGVGVAVGEE